MRLNRLDQQRRVGWALIADFVVRDDLILRFLNLDQSAELGRLRGFPFPDDLRGRLKEADDLVRRMQIITEDSRFGLTHHLLDEGNHALQFRL